MEMQQKVVKFLQLAAKPDDVDKTAEYGQQIVEKDLKDSPELLNVLAWKIVDPEGPKHDAKLAKVAVLAAQRADELAKGKDPGIADTLGAAYFQTGDPAKALEAQERAVKLAKGTPVEQDKGIQDRLEQYRKAVKK
jgi:hypothetical protein